MKVTIFKMNSMAMTSRYECTIINEVDMRYHVKFPRKKHTFLFNKNEIAYVFINKPFFLSDMDSNSFSGNALINFYMPGEFSEEKRKRIQDFVLDTKNYFENFYPTGKTIAETTYTFDGPLDSNQVMLFPDRETNHAVAVKIKNTKK